MRVMIEHEDEIDDILAKRLMRTLCKVKMLWRMLCIVSCIWQVSSVRVLPMVCFCSLPAS